MYGRLAAAVIRSGELRFAVCMHSESAVVCVVDVETVLLIRTFTGLDVVTLSDTQHWKFWNPSDNHQWTFRTELDTNQ